VSASSWEHLDALLIVRETDKALLVEFAETGQKWIPKSVIADVDNYDVGDADVTLSVQSWFCEKEGLV
jgi:hypothetical protein